MRIFLILVFAVVVIVQLNAQVQVDGVEIEKGQAHLDSQRGTFVSNLDGDYSVIIGVDYDAQSMTATVIDNVTRYTVCMPVECNFQ